MRCGELFGAETLLAFMSEDAELDDDLRISREFTGNDTRLLCINFVCDRENL